MNRTISWCKSKHNLVLCKTKYLKFYNSVDFFLASVGFEVARLLFEGIMTYIGICLRELKKRGVILTKIKLKLTIEKNFHLITVCNVGVSKSNVIIY